MFGCRAVVLLVVCFTGAVTAQNTTSEVTTTIPNGNNTTEEIHLAATGSTSTTPANNLDIVQTSPEPGTTTELTLGPTEVYDPKDEDPDVVDGDWDYLAGKELGVLRRWPEEIRRHRIHAFMMRLMVSTTTTQRAPHMSRSHGHVHGQAHGQAHGPGRGRGQGHRSSPHAHTHAHGYRPATRLIPPPPSWTDFCRQAAIEDEEPFRVSDGSFHPRFEEVPGVGVYRLHARARSWADARKVCEREGAQLAVPNSREEALALVEMHNRCPHLLPTHFNDYQYLGVHDQYSEGNWETVVGHPLNETGYVRWARNQPDNAHHHGENCLTMNRASSFNDVPCWTELPFICEHA